MQKRVIKANEQSWSRGMPNYSLIVHNWRKYLQYYDISILCEYIEFGFSFYVDSKTFVFNNGIVNHVSANRNVQGSMHTLRINLWSTDYSLDTETFLWPDVLHSILIHKITTQCANLHHLDIKMTTDPMSINTLF